MDLKILGWNIHGIRNKLEDDLLIKYVNNYDFVFLTETWLNNNIEIDGYYCYSKNRLKQKLIGRPSGGITLITKPEFRKGLKILEYSSDFCMCLKLDKHFFSLNEDLYIIVVYVPPEGASLYNVHNKNPFEEVQNIISKFSNLGQILLIGDFNARTSQLKDFCDSDISCINNTMDMSFLSNTLKPRRNQDQKKNYFGNLLVNMCKDLQLNILNGRTVGDLLGEFTSFQPNGCATVDYAITCKTLAKYISYFKIHNPNHLSDHTPISVSIKKMNKPFNIKQESKQESNCHAENGFKWNKNVSNNNFKLAFESVQIKPLINDFQNYEIKNNKNDVDFLCHSLTQMFIGAASTSLTRKPCKSKKKKSKKWQDKSYSALIKHVNDLGKKIKKFPNDPSLLGQYSKMKKEANKMRKTNNNLFKRKILEQLENLENNNSDEFWNLVNKIKTKKQNKCPINPNEYGEYFGNLFKQSSSNNFDHIVHKMVNDGLNNSKYIDILDQEFTLNEITDTIKEVKHNKSHGNDQIINEMFKSAESSVSPLILKLFNCILKSEYFPEQWAVGYITPVFKSGDPSELKNYRPITVTSNLSKLFTRILNKRLVMFLDTNKLLQNEQIGFKKGCSTSDHILVLKTIIDSFKSKNKPLYACFIDLSKAFDTVWREGLYYKLLNLGVSSKFVNLIKSMYTNVKAQIKVNGKLSKEIMVKVGTRQGCNLSPSLFNVYLNDLPKALDPDLCDPVLLYDCFVNILMYADDVVLLSSTKTGLQNCLNIFANYCRRWKLHINFQKTKSITFNTKKQATFVLNSKLICQTDSYCYLGIEFNKNGSFKQAYNMLSTKAKRAYFTWASDFNIRNNTPIDTLLKLFESTIKPILLYCSEIWGGFLNEFKKNKIEQLLINNKYNFEKLQLMFCKSALGLNRNASNIGALAELGRFPIVLTIMFKILKYYIRVLQMSDSFLVKKAMLQQNCMYNEERKNVKLPKRSFINAVTCVMKLTNSYEFNLNKLRTGVSKQCSTQIKSSLEKLYVNIYFKHVSLGKKEYDDTKLRTYNLVKNAYRKERYLSFIKNSDFRTAITKLRLSDHKLPIETGRIYKIPPNDRICNRCDSNILGDEFHILMECKDTKLSLLREHFLNNIYKALPQFNKLGKRNQFLYIFKVHDLTIIHHIAYYVYNVLKCFVDLV